MPLPLSCAGCAALTVSAVLLQILGVSLFTYGFFPVKPALPGRSGPESYQRPSCEASKSSAGQDVSGLSPAQLGSIYKELSEITPAFDRLVLMVIDGLPAEFVLGGADTPPLNEHMDAMPYTQSLLSSGKAIGYHAKAAPPTVTMPRLKAIVSGAIGSFLDVAFNFNTQAFLDDNLIEQFHRIGWKMVMLGDETWIKMFPRLFSRQDGVSSFYVKDTVEVDYNVTRHLDSELSADDWDLLILHYLGTDHVGHIGGRRSMLMKPKLNEMDGVIKKIFNSVILLDGNDSKRTLLLVVSDHGMTDSGNHGGSSHEETDALALFIVPGGQLPHQKPVRKAAYQVDVAPILAILFGVPIPKNNVGVLLPEMLDFLKEEEKLRALELNSWQLVRLLQGQLPGFCADTLCSRLHNPSSENVKLAKSEQVLCYSYTAAVRAHEFWRNHSDSNPK